MLCLHPTFAKTGSRRWSADGLGRKSRTTTPKARHQYQSGRRLVRTGVTKQALGGCPIRMTT